MTALRRVVNDNRIEYDGIHTEFGCSTMERDWTAYTKGLLRAEMAKRQITYRILTEKLAAIGVNETEANVRNKIARGGFTAVFFVQCLAALGVQTVRLDDA